MTRRAKEETERPPRRRHYTLRAWDSAFYAHTLKEYGEYAYTQRFFKLPRRSDKCARRSS